MCGISYQRLQPHWNGLCSIITTTDGLVVPSEQFTHRIWRKIDLKFKI